MSALTSIRSWLLAGAAALSLAYAANNVQAQDERQFQDWVVACPQPNACVARSDGSGARLLVGPGQPDRRMRMVVLVAAGTGKDVPVAIRFDDGTTVQLSVNVCNQANCQAIVRPDVVPEVLERMKGRREALVAYQSNNQVVLQPLSLRGFNAAIASLQ